jgi:hypothetical protein
VTLPRRRYLIVVLVSVLAAVVGLVGPAVYSWVTDTSAKDRIGADPPPALFAPTQTARVDSLVAPETDRADVLLRPWWRDHGSKPDDAAFRDWLVQSFPGPPSTAERSHEMTEVEALDAKRTDAGVTAATWLEQYGKKDVWKLAAHDQAEYLPAAQGDSRKNDVADLLSMSKDVADALGTQFQQSAPYVLEPSLRTDHTVTDGQVCPCSYPSRHASASAAARTYLGHLMPQRAPEYRWWEDQVDYSRIYMAGHVASDISGGALLGDMIGEYFLVTRTGATPGG